MVLYRRHVPFIDTHPLAGSTVMPTGKPTPRAVPSLVISVFLYLTFPLSVKTQSIKSLIRTEFHKGKTKKAEMKENLTHKEFQSMIRDKWEVIGEVFWAQRKSSQQKMRAKKVKSPLKFLFSIHLNFRRGNVYEETTDSNGEKE